MRSPHSGFSFILHAVIPALLVAQAGCVKRNLEFNCIAVLPTDPREAEMEMSPTKLQFKGIAYGFQEEAGAWRIYEASESKAQIRFNPASGQLLLGEQVWSCRRYEALLEKARP